MTDTTPETENEGTLKKGGDEAETLVWYVQHAQTTQDAVDHVRLMFSSRDTYWKERVAELIEKTIQEERYSGAPRALNKLKEAITNDNLK